MRLLRRLPLGSKLIVITTLISGLALSLGCGAFAVYEHAALRRSLARDFGILADMFGETTASGLAFNDPISIEQTLKTLRAHQHIVAAQVYDREGKPVARYRREAGAAFDFPAAQRAVQRFGRDRLDTFRDITLTGETIGVIYIGSDLQELRDRAWRDALLFAVLLIGCSLVTVVLAARMQQFIAGPILNLAQTAAAVAGNRNYAVRATKESDDEIGRLIDSFNEMLAQIQLRDVALQSARDDLEQRVADRTRELAVEKARFKFIFDVIPVGISFVVPDENITHLVNRAHERITGVSAADSSQPGAFARVSHPDDYSIQLERARPFIRGEIDHYTVEKRYLRPGGEVVWAVLTSRMFTDPATGKKQCVTSLIDITELKRAEAQIARERTRFKFIFDSAPVGICLDDGRNDKLTERLINEAHMRICGLAPDDLVDGVFRRISHPEDYVQQTILREQLGAGLIDRFSIEKRYLRPDGKMVWVAYSLQRRSFPDGTWQDLSTIVDITDLKQAQQDVAAERARFKFIFDSVPVGISLIVPGQRETQVANPAHIRITGISAEQMLQPGVFERATHPDDYERQRVMVQKYKEGEIDHFVIEKRYLHANGKVVWVSLERRMFTDASSGRKQSITTLIDITERKRAEARLAETHKQLLDASRQAGMAEVATGVLHNVGNVLNSVNVSSTLISDRIRLSKVTHMGKLGDLLAEHEADLGQFLSEDPRGRKIPEFVQTLAAHLGREQGELLKELEALRKNVDHIKDIVAMQQNYAKVSGVSERVSITDLIEDALRMNAGGAGRCEIAIVRDVRVNPIVTVEKHKVLQILVNLMRNARFACEESAHVEKEMTIRVTVEGRRVKIAVIDNGVGIPAENLTRIFSHGFTTRKDGHGFGLHSGAITAKELGGALRAQSDGPGRGAAFILELPLEAESKAA